MKVLNAAGLTPISLPKSHDKKPETKKLFPCKLPPKNPHFFTKSFGDGLAVLASVFSTTVGFAAKALTYEEALQQSVGSSSSSSSNFSDLDLSQFLDGIVKFGVENPLVVGGGAFVLVVPLVLSQVLKGAKPWGVESARVAYEKLKEDGGAQLVDIREAKEIKEVGSPDLRGLKKRAVSIAYSSEDKPGFLKKLALKFKDPENTTLFILDKLDGNSEFVAELATTNGFKSVFAIKDGAEGRRGWMKSGLPWSQPKKAIFDFGDLQDTISSAFGENSDGLPVTLGLAAAAGFSFFTFSEIETVLQLLGSAAIVQFITKKFLFAEDRKLTLQQIDEFLNTKVAPKELADEIKMIGKAFLPVPTSTAPVDGSSYSSTSATQLVKPEGASETKVEASAEPSLAGNSVPKAEITEESVPAPMRPLSPYPYYPDLKPPTSPCPSQP